MQVVNDVTSAFILPIDVDDADDSYHFIADVPGLEKGDIKACSSLTPIGCFAAKMLVSDSLTPTKRIGPRRLPTVQIRPHSLLL